MLKQRKSWYNLGLTLGLKPNQTMKVFFTHFVTHIKIKIKCIFRMEMNKALNIACDFKGYLVCQIPDNMVEVELKIKTTRGKYTLIKDKMPI